MGVFIVVAVLIFLFGLLCYWGFSETPEEDPEICFEDENNLIWAQALLEFAGAMKAYNKADYKKWWDFTYERNKKCEKCGSKNIVDKIKRLQGAISGSGSGRGRFLGSADWESSFEGSMDTNEIRHCKDCGHEAKYEKYPTESQDYLADVLYECKQWLKNDYFKKKEFEKFVDVLVEYLPEKPEVALFIAKEVDELFAPYRSEYINYKLEDIYKLVTNTEVNIKNEEDDDSWF